jgi:FlaA1/EpsC-like NDP-sugar epimerase|tara:strand:- start:54 stop:884 length:831 start_codon:yes stop_codon:yes gene_type:complete
MKTLITGATGHLGTSLVSSLLALDENKNNLVLLGNSEKRSDVLRRKYGVKVHVGDISNDSFLNSIFKSNKISRIIHCAAIKYVSISNDNPTRTVEVNVIGSYNLYNLAIKYDVQDMISVSTDKAINPTNIYGMSKRLMEAMAIERGFTVISGVNFFGSTGSVLDIWFDQVNQKKELTITDLDCVRYFVKTEDMVNLILGSFGKNSVIHCDKVYRVLMGDLLLAFKKVFNYEASKITGLLEGEKIIEEIPKEVNVLDSTDDLLEEMVSLWKMSKFED